MSYYDALSSKWATLTGTKQQKLDALNATTVPGPNVDVEVSAIVGKLMLSGAYLALAAFAQGNPTGDTAHDQALFSAKLLMTCITIPNAPSFQMSDADTATVVTGMMDVLLAYELAHAGTTGFTQVVHDTLLGLCKTTLPWGAANGYVAVITPFDLEQAGLS